jgi:2'-5' RNA ligase
MSHVQNETVDSETARLFLALWPDAATASALLAQCGKLSVAPGVYVVPPERLHLTMHFLGNVAQCRLSELILGLRVPFLPFELSFSRCAHWSPGLIVTTADAVPQPMAQLHTDLSEALLRLGLHVDNREFRPHLTLARRHPGPLPAPAAPPLRWPVEGYALVQSLTAPLREYHIVHDYK